MARVTLTNARVTALRPRKSAHDTRDSKLTGFGVRIFPSPRNPERPHCDNLALWYRVRRETDIEVYAFTTSATPMRAMR